MTHGAVDVIDLHVHYDKTPVLFGLTFSIPPGQLVGVVGPNGAGKSTLLKTLLGLHPVTSGWMSLLGNPLKAVRRQIAYMPQRNSVDWDFPITVFDVVLMGRYGKMGLFKWANKEDRKKTEEALDKLGMLPFAKRQISELSGGQQQRVFLARALLQDADLYFMDEPFAGIDLATEKALVAIFAELKAKGKTLFVVHHDLTTVSSYFDWVLMLNSCLIASGPVQEVFHEDNLRRTFGGSAYMLNEAKKLSRTPV